MGRRSGHRAKGSEDQLGLSVTKPSHDNLGKVTTATPRSPSPSWANSSLGQRQPRAVREGDPRRRDSSSPSQHTTHYTLRARQSSSEFPDRAPAATSPAPQPEKVRDGWMPRLKISFNRSEQVVSSWRLENVSKRLRVFPLAWNRENVYVARVNLDGQQSSF